MDHLINVELSHFGDLQESSASHIEKAKQELEKLKNKTCLGSEQTNWFDWPSHSGFELQKNISHWVDSLNISYDLIVVCGIGGSYIGSRAVSDALRHSYSPFLSASGQKLAHKNIVYAGHNLSESEFVELLELLEDHQPIINVISKSGTTTEPSIAFRVLRNYMEERFGEASNERIIVTTDKEDGSLRSLANDLNYKSFEVPSGIGGRYSVLTAVGLVPLELAGFNTEELLAGADRLFESLKNSENLEEHPVIKLATSRKAAWDAGLKIDLFSYGEPRLFALIEWWKQLFGESEGKESKGLFPASMLYSTDLHSLGQYIQQGFPSMLETFLFIENPRNSSLNSHIEKSLRVPHVKNNDDGIAYLEGKYISDINLAAMESARRAHSERGVPCLSLSVAKIDAYHLGYLIAFFEVVCSLSAALLEVNPFDQEGVEAYKTNLFQLLGKPGY